MFKCVLMCLTKGKKIAEGGWAMSNDLPRGNVVVSPFFRSPFGTSLDERADDPIWLGYAALLYPEGRLPLVAGSYTLLLCLRHVFTSLRSVFFTDRVLAFARTVGRWWSALCVMSVSSAFYGRKKCMTIVRQKLSYVCHTVSYNMTYNCHTRKALFHGINRPLGDCPRRDLYDKSPYPDFKYFGSN